MTGQEWLTCTDLTLMLGFLRGRVSDRKLRLSAVGWCERMPNLSSMADKPARIAVRYAEGSISREMLRATRRDCPYGHSAGVVSHWLLADDVQAATTSVLTFIDRTALPELAKVFREVFGPLPFRSVAFDPSWLTSAAKHLAEAIYTEKAFDRLPILADALEESGCTSQDILTHLRLPGEHVRGCWVLDLVLGKE